MKKLFILAILAGACSLTSCKKDYTCECKDNTTGIVDITYTQKSTKSKAKTWCSAFNTQWAILDSSCALK